MSLLASISEREREIERIEFLKFSIFMLLQAYSSYCV